MAQPLHRHLPALLSLLVCLSRATADASFTVSKAAYYPNSVDCLMQTVNLTCQLLSRTHGAVWAAVSPPSGPLSIRMLFSGGAPRGGDQKWLVPTSTIPQNWTAGAVYDSGVQVQLQ